MLRRLYDWVRHWAETPYGTWALFILAFCESSFFPIPPDVLLIALAVSLPAKSFRYAAVCSVGSVLGAVLGYLIGWQFMDLLGKPIIAFYGFQERVAQIQSLFHQYDAWAIGIAGFTPIPYKLFTIAAGMFEVNFAVLMVASIISRSARFFLVAWFIYAFGPRIQRFIDRYFDLLAVVFTVLLIGGFILLKYLF
jgi:membrane protein YqaA with SNARE-associated domain